MNRYKYTDKARAHLHELSQDGGTTYAPLIGTTTALNEVFPPPLAWWGSAQALQRFGWITEKKEPDVMKREELLKKGQDEVRLAADMNLEDYRSLLESCYKAHDEYKKSKGKEGVDIHALIEEMIRFCLDKNGGQPTTMYREQLPAFTEWAMRDVKQFLWSEAHCYSSRLFVGGITDFGFIHKNGKVIVGDNKPSIYPKNFIQTALYGIQIKENGLCDASGKPLDVGWNATESDFPKIDGYCIFDYNKGVVRYRIDIERLERIGETAIDLYKNKDVIGSLTLE